MYLLLIYNIHSNYLRYMYAYMFTWMSLVKKAFIFKLDVFTRTSQLDPVKPGLHRHWTVFPCTIHFPCFPQSILSQADTTFWQWFPLNPFRQWQLYLLLSEASWAWHMPPLMHTFFVHGFTLMSHSIPTNPLLQWQANLSWWSLQMPLPQGWLSQCFIFTLHKSDVNPCGHWQEKLPGVFRHFAELKQGIDKHSLTSSSQ